MLRKVSGDLPEDLQGALGPNSDPAVLPRVRSEVLREVSGDLLEHLQGALGPNSGPTVLPRTAEDFPAGHRRVPRAPQILRNRALA